MNVLRCSIVFLALALAVACSGNSGFVATRQSSAPGSGAAQNYVGTFPITYTSAAGTCGTSVLPTALKITGTATGSGGAILLSGSIIGGSAAFNGSNLQSNGDSANPEYPSAFVFDNSLAILSAAGTLPGPLYQLEIDVVAWNPPATTGPEVLVWFNSTSCSETDEFAILGTPAP
ncbi:MAG: hypothetical protein WA629_13680 [Candidatus Aquilonibacter sp.]